MIAFERPQSAHAMRLPAPPSILKLSRESDIRRSAGLPHLQLSGEPPCNFAAASPVFSPVRRQTRKIGFPVQPQSQRLAESEPPVPFPRLHLLEICHIGLAQVTLLATIASATHAL